MINDYVIFILPVDTSWPEESYGGISTENRLRAARDRAALPTAPRAARGPDIDSTKIPDGPPFTAFLGNLSYDVDKDDILEFFGNNKVLSQLYMIWRPWKGNLFSLKGHGQLQGHAGLDTSFLTLRLILI